MAKKTPSQKPYKRLPGRIPISIIGVSSLWLGADHFLMMTTNGPMEIYKRFYFRDVQALLIQPNNRRLLFGLAYGMLLLLFVWLAIWSFFMLHHKSQAAGDSGWKVAFWFECSFAALSFIALTINQLLGRGCNLLVQTAVQTERLTPVKRTRTARKLLAILTPKIEAEQREKQPTAQS